jgi:primosomal protein N' (replication factor Y)
VRIAPRVVRRHVVHTSVGARRLDAPALTGEQETALAAILAAEPGEGLLLHGVTGSGKTEVYLQAVARALERGETAIVLVPEIGLTPQIVSRFVDRFGDTVAVLHSKLGAGERHDEWARLRAGEARVCVGPRSAVFAPLDRLGLVIVDEEHDSSYKHEGDPRYDARAVAAQRARMSGAVLVAGTATPRPESFLALRRLRMGSRVDGASLPKVEMVDMREAKRALHPLTVHALHDASKSIVLLNRRGWSNFLTCRSCARVWGCPQCDVSLVLHRSAARLACHHCGHSEPVPRACPDCGSVSVARHGVGTERLEGELEAILDPLPVVRLDADTSAGGTGVGDVLRRFDAAPAGVLVGTQMVAKGHDFPAVTLGVVLDADATLRFPDFRSEERTFAMVAQLAGRSGRGAGGGRVIVPALDPAARSLEYAARHDAEGFLAGELERRQALGYPPFGHLIRVVCSSPEAGPEAAAARAVMGRVADRCPGWGSVLGPAALFRVKGRERAQLVVKASARAPAVEAVRDAVEAVAGDRTHRGVAFSVDVDPQ